jgi:hypothetical protein
MPTDEELRQLDELAEHAGRNHAHRVFALALEFPIEVREEVFAVAAESLGVAIARFAELLREKAPQADVDRFCGLVTGEFFRQLAMAKLPVAGSA